MKIALVILLSAAAVIATEVKLRDGITPQKLPAIQLSQDDLPPIAWEHIRDILLNKGEKKDSGYVQADVSEYALEVLEYVQQLIINQGFDPMGLPESEIKLIPTGTIDLSNGWLENLSTITVSDSVIAKYTPGTKVLEITLPIAFDKVLISYDYHTKIILLSIKGTIEATVTNFKLNLHLGFNFTDYHAFVDKADVKDSGSIDIKFTGLGLLDWVIDLMIDVLTTFFHGIILSVVNAVIDIPVASVVETINELIDSVLQKNSTAFMTY